MNYDPKLRLLAVDLSTRMGWAVLDHGQLASGVVSFARRDGTKHRAADHSGEGYLQMSRWVHRRLADLHPTVIAYEEVFRWMSGDSAKAYGAYRGVLLAQAALCGIPCIGYSPTAIKKAWTGKGTANKEQMVDEVRRRFPDLQIIDDNHADALAILHHHLNQP